VKLVPNPSNRPAQPAPERLDSWKEIARYLKRDESTVQRWEKREGMPVHRHVHDKRGSVYAFAHELDAWWASRRLQLDVKSPPVDESPAAEPDVVEPTHSATAGPVRRRWPSWLAIAVGLLAIGVAAAWWLPGTPSRRANPGLTRLTSTSGLNIDPALSLDGTRLAFASDRAGQDDLDIWIQPTSGGEATQITSDPVDESEPSFSPDGASIVFAKGETGGIYVVPAAGGEARQLASTARAHRPRFSPDGRWVSYWTGLPAWVFPSPGASTGGIFVVPASGGSPRAVASDFSDARDPVWSPDGQRLLFLGVPAPDLVSTALDWYVVNREGGEPTRTGAIELLRAAGVAGTPIPAAWTDEGVTFSTYDQGASNVWQLAVSPSTRRASGTPVRLTFGSAIERHPSVSASGRVAFASLIENVDVWRLPIDHGTGQPRAAVERVTDNAAIDVVLNVSDDGRRLVFRSSRSGRDEVWVRELASGQERQITSTNVAAGLISHDGSMVAVGRGQRLPAGIDLVPLDGGAPTPLCDDCMSPEWAPGDARLVIRKGQGRLFIRDRASGRESELTAHPAWALNRPRFSRDGRWLAFHTANSPSLRQIYAVPTDVTRPLPVESWTPIVSDFGVQASWSPDGSAVYHFSLRDGNFCAWRQVVDPATKRPVGAPTAVQHFHHPRLRAVSGAIATNDVTQEYMYATLTETAANIWLLDR
jgi:Tol biopolymer transport system component